MPDRRRLLGDLSWLQILVGALAAMTSAWIASALGVGGTIIGAAIGSLVVPVSGALYGRTLDKGRVLVVRTDRGTTVRQRIESDDDTEVIIDEAADADPRIQDASVVEPAGRLHWRTILLTTAAVLVLAVAGMTGYELLSGETYGGHPDNASIVDPFGGSSVSEPSDGSTPNPEATTPAPSATATPLPTATPPTATPSTPAPTPTQEPVVPAE